MPPTSGGQATLPGVPPEGTRSRAACQLRDRLAVLHRSLDLGRPDALDLATELHEAVHGALSGVISNLGGHRAPDKWRKAVGAVDRDLTVVDLAYLAVLRRSESREAIRRVVEVLSRSIDARPVTGTLAGRIAEAAQAATALLAQLARAQEDGQLDDAELEDIRHAAVPLTRAAQAVESVAAGGSR